MGYVFSSMDDLLATLSRARLTTLSWTCTLFRMFERVTYIFILRLLEFLADEIRNGRQTPASEEIRVFQWEDLKSAEIIIDGKKSWKLVLDKGGGSLIKGLWRSGADLTKLDENGKTMLHVAVEHGNKPVVMLLQSLGFNMKAKDSKGKTAWDFANEGSMISMKNLLWKYDIWES